MAIAAFVWISHGSCVISAVISVSQITHHSPPLYFDTISQKPHKSKNKIKKYETKINQDD